MTGSVTIAALHLHFEESWWVYVSMPIVAAIVGYVTKLVLIKMIFEPVEFVGIKPFLGWQGMVPRRAAKMAGIAVEAVIGKLITPRELFDRVDPEEMLAQIEGPLHDSLTGLVEEVMSEFNPGVWEAMPDVARRQIVKRIEQRLPQTSRRLMETMRDNVDRVLDIKHMVVTSLVRDKRLLNRMMRDISTKALKFIARAGMIFGFFIGLVQVTVFVITGSHLILPLFGLLTGGLTDWIALHMIFRPVERGRVFGIYPWQGLFHNLRHEVTRDYAALLAKDIFTPAALLDSLLNGPMSDQLFKMIEDEVKRTVDEQTGFARPLVAMTIGGRKYQAMKKRIAEKVIERIPDHVAYVETYTMEALDIENLAAERMALMSSDEYEELLRPAFRDDEKTVVIVGAILGFIVGELQAHLVLG